MRRAAILAGLTAGSILWQVLAADPLMGPAPDTPTTGAPPSKPAPAASSTAPSATAAPAAAATQATQAAPATSAAPAASTTPNAPATATSAAPAATAADDNAQLEKRLRGKGYAERMQNGEKVYCRREDTLGSRLGGALHCMTVEQARAFENEARENTEHMQRQSGACLPTAKGSMCGN